MKTKKSPPITQNPSGLPEGPSSTSSPFAPDQGPDVPPVPATVCPQCGSLTNWSGTQHPDGTLSNVSAECPACGYTASMNSSSPTLSEADLEKAAEHKTFEANMPPNKAKWTPSLAQSVLSRLSAKLPSKALVVPRGTPILSGKAKGHSKTSGE
jgi:hypothetical protein